MSQTEDFGQLLAEVSLRQAADELNEGKLAEAEESYREALKSLNTAEIRGRIQGELEDHFDNCLAAKKWQQARGAITILDNVEVTNAKKLASLNTKFLKNRAQAYLKEELLDAAFECLKLLDDTTRKSLVKIYIQDKAQLGKWVAGDKALKRLVKIKDDDIESITWRGNWLFIWAETLYSQDKAARKPIQTKRLCRKILEILKVASTEPPVINLLADPPTATKDAPSLHHQTCALLGDILLTQIRTCLSLPDLAEAERFFKEALDLPIPPERQLLIALAFDQAQRSLKAGRPDQAFFFLNHLKDKLNDEDRTEVKKLIYRFSRLYVGRDCWDTARKALRELRQWLALPDEEIDRILDHLNYEWLVFVKAQRLLATVPMTEIKRQQIEVEVAEAGYRDAGMLELHTQDTWAAALIQVSLSLGQTHLANDNLDGAIQSYQKVVDLPSHHIEHEAQISQSLHSYGKRMLAQKKWTEALEALSCLKKFNLTTPDDQSRPDPRVDGAIQRVILVRADVSINKEQIKEAFAQLEQLKTLESPWPTGQIKEIIWNYCQKRRNDKQWPNANEALERLDKFLMGGDEGAYDQEALERLVDSLAGWGQRLRKNGDLKQAEGIYQKAIKYTSRAIRRKSATLTDTYIRQITLLLAQDQLEVDLQTPDTTTAIDQAIGWYEKTLSLPEHHNEHEELINQALEKHINKLAEAGWWSRADYALDKVNNLYGKPKAEYKTLFASWRRIVALAEVETRLEQSQLDEALERLSQLKNWLDNYQAPQASWLDQAHEIKRVYGKFYPTWLDEKKWPLAAQASENLTSLLPNDSIVTSWEVQAHYQWGQALQEQDLFKEALDHYEEALKKANEQMVNILHSCIVATKLIQAQQCLKVDNLEEAVRIYRQALDQRGDHPDRAYKIRQALEAHGDSRVALPTPDWEEVERVFDYLKELGITDSEVRTWQQQLILRQVKETILDKDDNVKVAFDKLATMPPPLPLGDIQEIVKTYSEARVETEAWEKSIEVFESMEIFLDVAIRQFVSEDVRQSVAKEAEILADKLREELYPLRGNETYLQRADTLYDLVSRLRKAISN